MEQHFQGAMGIDKQPGVTHPTPGLLHQMTSTPWLVDKLRPRRIGTLLVYVRLPSGQLSSYKVESKDTVASLKAKVAATAVARALEEEQGTEALLYMGRELGDDETFEAALVADRAMLVRPGRARCSSRRAKAVGAAKAPLGSKRRAHQVEPKRGLDLDYTASGPGSLHAASLACYAWQCRRSTASPNHQSAEYERACDPAWRHDCRAAPTPGDQARRSVSRTERDEPRGDQDRPRLAARGPARPS